MAAASEVVVVTSEILESASVVNEASSRSGADDLLIIEGRLPVVVEVAEVAPTVNASEAKEVKSNKS
jgi:hypothetical protein